MSKNSEELKKIQKQIDDLINSSRKLGDLTKEQADVTFKILDGHDEKKIEKELAGLKKINKNASPELSTRLKYIITSVGEEKESKAIREFVDTYLLARDSRALREYINLSQPDIDLTYTLDDGEEVKVPIGLNFFWPDYEGGL